MNIVERLKDSLDYEYNLSFSERKQLLEEIDRLKDLCNKYEEEHKTAFKLWTQKMEEMPDYEERMKLKKEFVRLNNIIKNQDRKIKLAIKIFENINKIYGESSSINDVIDVLKENK